MEDWKEREGVGAVGKVLGTLEKVLGKYGRRWGSRKDAGDFREGAVEVWKVLGKLGRCCGSRKDGGAVGKVLKILENVLGA